MTENNQIAQAMEYFSGTMEISKTLRFKSQDQENGMEVGAVTITVSASSRVSQRFWEELQDKYAQLQEETVRIFVD